VSGNRIFGPPLSDEERQALNIKEFTDRINNAPLLSDEEQKARDERQERALLGPERDWFDEGRSLNDEEKIDALVVTLGPARVWALIEFALAEKLK
jgi:hypothetical protein